jgi:hypothetical protein
MMAKERFYGPGEPFWGWRCLLCGEITDPLIFENRVEQTGKFRKGMDPKG